MTTCETCSHPTHHGRCNHPITEDIYASADPYGYGPATIFVRSIIIDRCRCSYIDITDDDLENWCNDGIV